MEYPKQNVFCYRLAQAIGITVSVLFFRRKWLRNEIKGVKGPYVVIANHQAQFDFVNLIGATCRPLSFVISHAFYSTLPIRKFLDRMGVIPKQQFQTALSDMKRIKSVLDDGRPVVIYPAGLMCEDGVSTPIPQATYKFLKWLGVDVYMARTVGAYFVQPKWGKGLRAGRTYMDIYKLFDQQELAALSLDEIKARTDDALLFDAYREQDACRLRYRGNDLVGLQNVLYQCPVCKQEFTVSLRNKRTLGCDACGFTAEADEYGLFDGEWRYVSDWSQAIRDEVKRQIASGELTAWSVETVFRMVDPRKNKFVDVGNGTLTLTADGFRLQGELGGEPLDKRVAIGGIPTLPFAPGKYLDIQEGKTIYRCVPKDGRQVMKAIRMVQAYYELNTKEKQVTG